MARVDLKQGDQKKHVAKALKAIRDGYVIVAPLEHGYVYVTDAFSPFAVRSMHVLRGDADGVAAQVLTHSAKTTHGIARDITPELQSVMDEFWPGLLSITLKPNRGLNWDLGDDRTLDLINVRVPKSRFMRAILKESGPLAIASASAAGTEPMRTIDRSSIKDWDVAHIFDNGQLPAGKFSTLIEVDGGGIRVVREGAVSVSEIAKVAPSLSR